MSTDAIDLGSIAVRINDSLARFEPFASSFFPGAFLVGSLVIEY